MRILHIGNGFAFKIKAIISFLRDRGHEIHFIPIPSAKESWEGITYHHLPPIGRFSKLQVIRNMLLIKKMVRAMKPDIIHAHNARGPGWYGAFCGYHPFIIHAYGSDVLPFYYTPFDFINKLFTAYTCKKADRIIVTGEHMINGSSHLGIPKDKIKVLSRGVDIKRFKSGLDTIGLKGRLSITDSSPIILSPRYQIDEALYNFDTIIESIRHVKKLYPNVLLIQLYDASREKHRYLLEGIAQSSGVLENYKMVKAVDNEEMPYFYNLADICVSVPSTDGFPVTVLEASACGTPMIVTRLEYTYEWFTDDVNGILIPEREPVALADAIIRLFQDNALMQKMATINRELVKERADYEKCMVELETLYYELLSENTA